MLQQGSEKVSLTVLMLLIIYQIPRDFFNLPVCNNNRKFRTSINNILIYMVMPLENSSGKKTKSI